MIRVSLLFHEENIIALVCSASGFMFLFITQYLLFYDLTFTMINKDVKLEKYEVGIYLEILLTDFLIDLRNISIIFRV